MNIIAYLILLIVCLPLWKKSGVYPNKKYFWVAFILIFLVWSIWGQVAVADKWWIYNDKNIGPYIGFVPVADDLYFLAGLGWFLYLLHKLGLL